MYVIKVWPQEIVKLQYLQNIIQAVSKIGWKTLGKGWYPDNKNSSTKHVS